MAGATDAADGSGLRTRIAVVLPLLPIAGLGLAVGVQDGVLAPQLGARVLGVFLALAALVLCCGIVFLFVSATTQRWSVFCFAAGALVGGVCLTLQVSAQEETPVSTVVWLLELAYPLVLAGYLWVKGARRAAPGPGRLAAVISVVTVTLGILQALYSVAYAPIKHPDTLQVQVTTSLVADSRAEAQNFQAVKSSYTIKNQGDAKLLIVGSVYAVVGMRAHLRGAAAGGAFDSDRQTQLASSGAWSARYQSNDDLQPVEIGTDPLGVGGWIPAGGEQDGDILSYVPQGAYDSYSFEIQLISVRADRVSMADYFPLGRDKTVSSDKKYLYAEYPLQQTALSRVTQGTRYLQVQYYLDDKSVDTGQMMFGYASSRGHAADSGYQLRQSDYYGMFTTGGGALGSLTPAGP